MNSLFIALGGNIGDVPAHFRAARNRIEALPQTHVLQSSLLYQTPPLGPPGQPDYCNAVIELASTLAPLDLLNALQKIEVKLGRIRAEHWGARTLDLDIIAIGREIIDSDRLIVPHPLMQHRQFVLRPLCDIAPNWQHPRLDKTAIALLNTLLQTGESTLPKGIAW